MVVTPAATAPIDSKVVRRRFRRQVLIGALALAMMLLATLVLLMEVQLNEEVESSYQQALSIAQRALDAHRLASQLARQQARLASELPAAPGADNQIRLERDRGASQLAQISRQIDRIGEVPLTAEERGNLQQVESGLAAIAASAAQASPGAVAIEPARYWRQFEAVAASLDSLSASVSARALKTTERSRFLNLIARYTLAMAVLLAVSFGTLFGVLILRSQAASRDEVAALDKMAREDGLTGITNRRGLDEGLVIELARARRTGLELTVVMLDLDHFKRYNDRRGHGAGDSLLRNAAQAWRRQLRPTDLLARYGGEEFTLVLPACDADAACQLIERLRPLMPDRQTFSAGVATWEQHESPQQLLARADRALLVAKKQGRNRTVVSGREPQMTLPLQMA
ncbi:MAG TPA: GGDEF domain-containing protein [Burkholderiaceae bacterium]|jgi:diguanylate cyclase (GGDEF)-like protein|nr:GGDEF domain-containing protein [Burkholderiaceae bacterium]